MALQRQAHLHNAPAQQDQADGPDDGKDEGTEVVDNSQRVALGQHRRGGAADQNQSGIQREGAAGQTFGAGHINLVAMHTLYPQFTAWQRARQEAANCPAESSGRVGSTGEARARQAAQAQRNKAAQAAAEQAQLAADILSSLTKGEFEIREIYAYANASLVTYSKAAKFKVIREEIPCFNASFSAESAAKQLGLKEEGGTE